MNASTKTSRELLALIKEHGPISTPALAKLSGKKVATINFYMRLFHGSDPKQVYVAKARATVGRGRNARLWAAGDQPDDLQLAAPRELPATQVVAEDEDESMAKDKRRRAAIAENRVHRDPMLFLTAGVAP